MPDETTSAASMLPLPLATFHILLALANGERHGYAIIQDVAKRTNGELQLSPGTLYRSVQRMLQQGLIAETGNRRVQTRRDERRRFYCLTPFGTDVADAEAKRLDKLVQLARSSGFATGGA